MIGAIAHRGPDAQGVFVGDNVGLAHARLSIIDLASGQQPMANADGTLHVTFNGEIFNYVELRDELIARGHRFATTSDTEVILHAYEAYGADCVEQFNGDFAFAIWDSRNKRLMLARDRMGVRPLFHTSVNGCLYFASEVKALLEAPGISAELDPIALDQIFTFWFPLAPRTPFKDISELPPAHVLIAEGDSVTVRPYWRLDYPDAADADALRPAQRGRDRRGTARAAARRHPHPAALRRAGRRLSQRRARFLDRHRRGQAHQPDRLRTFSVTFESEEFDESAFQQDMVRALGTEHATVRLHAPPTSAAPSRP